MGREPVRTRTASLAHAFTGEDNPPSRPNLVVRLDAMPRWLCVLVSDERPAVAAAVKEVAGGGDALLLGLLSKGAAHILCPTRRQRHPARQAVRP